MAQLNLIIRNVAAEHGINERELDYHVRDLHGWVPSETGFFEAVEEAAKCRREECVVILGDEFPAPREHVVSDTEECWCSPERIHLPHPETATATA